MKSGGDLGLVVLKSVRVGMVVDTIHSQAYNLSTTIVLYKYVRQDASIF